ncbi:MAG: hypothetical protein EAZ85_13915 [Bacteroidetes bacterium]|nr:MAG: hypothetical protein EAZ85_13915 [Bacteroidota bacterium]
MLFSSSHIQTQAQSYAETVLQFSRLSLNGTARYQGLAGCNVALGGDIASASTNPAGLGFYTKSEISITPGLNIVNTETTFLRNTNKDGRTAPSLGGIGFVIALPSEKKSKWRGGALAINATRINQFPFQFSYQGDNKSTSKTDWYADQARGIRTGDLENLDVGPNFYPVSTSAYYARLINPDLVLSNGNPDPNNTTYFTYVRDANENLFGNINQKGTYRTSGGQTKWSIAYGGNYDDKLFIGMGIGISSLNYSRNKDYAEKVLSNSSILDNYKERDNLKTSGTGVDANFGLMYRPIEFLRVGASITSPTFYNVYETFDLTFDTQYYNSQNVLKTATEPTLPGEYNYSYNSPWRFNAGGSIFIGKYGFFTAEAEYIGYNAMVLRGKNSGDLKADSDFLNRFIKPVWNYRGAFEFRYDIYRLRAGYNYQANPYTLVDNIDRNIHVFTGGIGIRKQTYFLEFALARQSTNSIYQPYVFSASSPYSGKEPIVQIKQVWWSGVITFGLHF